MDPLGFLKKEKRLIWLRLVLEIREYPIAPMLRQVMYVTSPDVGTLMVPLRKMGPFMHKCSCLMAMVWDDPQW